LNLGLPRNFAVKFTNFYFRKFINVLDLRFANIYITLIYAKVFLFVKILKICYLRKTLKYWSFAKASVYEMLYFAV